MRARPALAFGIVVVSVVTVCAGPNTPPAGAVWPPVQGTNLPGLVCIQNALGGTRAFAAVTSLRILAETTRAAKVGPPPGTREITVVFPDRYRRSDIGAFPGGGALASTVGFERDQLLSMPRGPDTRYTMQVAREDFVRQMLLRLPRTLPGATLSQATVDDGGARRLAIVANGPEQFRATLLADADSCVPVALLYTARGPHARVSIRVDVAEYRAVAGIRFPTVLNTSQNGAPYTSERVSSVQVNVPGVNGSVAPRPTPAVR